MAQAEDLRAEIAQLRQEITVLHQEKDDLERENADLKVLIETNIEHSDFVEDELLHDLEFTQKNLQSQIEQLLQEEARLKRENTDLELLIEMTIEHSDFVEDELLESIRNLESVKKKLLSEITKLRREIEELSQRIAELRREKTDLEALMELNIEHADFIEEDLLNKVDATLRESERRFRLISETIPIPMIVTLVADNTIIYANEPTSILFGDHIETLLGSKFSDFYDSATRNPVSEEALAAQGYISNYELQVRQVDGTPRWVSLSSRFLTFNDKPCLLNTLYDMTDRKQAEQKIRSLNEELELRVEERTIELQEANQALKQSLESLRITQEQLVQAEKAVALTDLVTGIAHEINTPVGNAVMTASYLEQKTIEIKELYEEGKMKRSDLENYVQAAQTSTVMILRNLQRAAEQIQSFKQVAVDQTSSEKRLFKLKSYIDDLLVSILPKLKEAQHTINVHCPKDIEITSYPGAFSQIITHFVMNTLTHGFEHKTRGEIVLDITREENILQIQYRDNGKGMTKEERSRIFDAFYTTRRGQGGTGLGLHIVYNLITQQLGGDITCKSSPGAGTTFIIWIPLESD